MPDDDRQRSHWAWGWAHKLPDENARRLLAAQVSALLGVPPGGFAPREAVPLAAARIAPSRAAPPPALAAFTTADDETRARRTYGRAWRDQWRGFHGDFAAAPDLVARPRDEREVEGVLEWAAASGAWVVPWGGGTSVVGGVEAVGGRERAPAVVALDLGALEQVLEVDTVSRAARIQAGALGPALERQLAAHGLTLRFFPQSFEHSTLGGWIATRAGGHYATGPTHIDDLVEAVRLVTPTGVWQSRRLPASGAGPSPDRLALGSEGAFGVITEAWVRVVPRPRWRASASVRFAELAAAVDAARAIAQSGLWPANCRLLDAREATINMVAQNACVLVLGFESADHALEPWMERALAIARGAGGEHAPPQYRDEGGRAGGGEAGRWREAFLAGPYLQPALLSLGIIADTFETACTWDRFESLYRDVTGAVREAARRLCGAGEISCRFTHVYSDGPAPYFTFIAPARAGEEERQWAELKRAASDAVIAAGGTITHHHAVGRTHEPWWRKERPEPFYRALAAAKAAIDPKGIMNPGVLGLTGGDAAR
jgi:alkyldihydroxyacetonephosphate synthase